MVAPRPQNPATTAPLEREQASPDDRDGERTTDPGLLSDGERTTDPGLLSELQGFELLSPAQRLERAAEYEILILLQLQRFSVDTPEWQTLSSALIEYGYSVFKAWFVTGAVRQIAADHARGRGVLGLGKIPEGLRLDDDDAHALAVELITASVEAFRTKTLMDPARTWRPTGGASLKTYFIGRTLMELPDAYERWWRAEKKPIRTMDLTDDGRHSDDPADHAAAACRVDELLPDTQTRVMFELQQKGHSLDEIADMLTAAGYPQTEGSVRTRMSRARATARSF